MTPVVTIDLANSIFIVCILAGGVLLLLTVLLDDILEALPASGGWTIGSTSA